MAKTRPSVVLQGLNEEQVEAVCHGDAPLLVVAGAGTGKTRTLVHRVAHLIERGVDPNRILLLTFTRRAAGEMLRRVDTLLRELGRNKEGQDVASSTSRRIWGGTFHATAARLLRIHGNALGLDPGFTIHDRSDSEDLLEVLRTELGMAKTDKRFPKKRSCMAIYSHCVNSQEPLEKVLERHYAWCSGYAEDLKRLFKAYTDRKDDSAVLDYDDLLLFWHGLVSDPQVGERVRERFDAVLVDEFQDTNRLQADILKQLRPDGGGLTAVGDDAQSIYSFRAATIRNILEFPKTYPGTTIVKLEQNYRSTQPILDATNVVIAQSKQRYAKKLWTERKSDEKPLLVTCQDDDEQAEYVAGKILERREQGIDLREQAVLFRASHNSIVLEAELARHDIPYVKYGGLKFSETAHVKDMMAMLRLAENTRDVVAGVRALKLLPGIGPKKAVRLMQVLWDASGDWKACSNAKVPSATKVKWPKFVKLMRRLTSVAPLDLTSQIRAVLKFYKPLLERLYDNPEPRLRDLEQLEHLAARFADRRSMLAELALDPPTTTGEFDEQSDSEDDYLTLSTVHSAKGLEWDTVYTLSASDGVFPLHRASTSREQIEEERRLFYVALTRAKNSLFVCFPLRTYQGFRSGFGDPYGIAKLSRFMTKDVKRRFQHTTVDIVHEADSIDESTSPASRRNVRRRARSMWS